MEEKPNNTKTIIPAKTNLRQYLLRESFAMVKHLSTEGKAIPLLASSILDLEKHNCCEVDMKNKEILKLHRELSKKIAPAHPKTIWLLYQESQTSRWLNFLGPVTLIRRFMLVAIISLFAFIALSCNEFISVKDISEGIYKLDNWPQFIILSFYLTSASLGASFSTLFQANRFIINNTFDPKYESSYWIRYVLGIIAGIMLATIIPMPDNIGKLDNANAQLVIASRPLLAMLGGFSSALVYRILYRMVFAVESVFIGKQSDQVEAKITNINAKNEMAKENEKQRFVNQLVSLQGQINLGKSTDEMNAEIQKKISEMSD